MDKIKVGDKLRKGDAVITIAEIYLFQMHPGDKFAPVVIYEWENTRNSYGSINEKTFDMDWEGWEKV